MNRVDERQFDSLSRRVAALTERALPRRGILRGLALTGLGGALGLDSLLDAEARKNKNKKNKNKNKKKCKRDGKKCKKSKDCCDSRCEDRRCGGSSGRCGTNVSANTSWGSTGSGDGQFRSPWGIATDKNGDVYVTDTGNSRVQIFNSGGSFIRRFGSQGNGVDRFQEPRGIGVNQESNNNNNSGLRVFVSDPAQNNLSHRLRKFRTDGTDLASLGQNGLGNPRGVAIDGNNNVWVVDGSSGQIFLFDRSGNLRTNWSPSGGGSLSAAEGIAVFEDSRNTFVYVSDRSKNQVLKYEYTGDSSSGLSFITSAGSQGGGSNSFNEPMGIAADSCGNIWVADRINNRVQQLDKDLSFRSRFSASLNRPTGVAVSPNGKNLYVVDSSNDRVQLFDLR